ncbi:MAG: hypothetical protein KME04_17885 [Pleurocapsa minor GSE-CHR-MK-17-07R]|nr:hypothetical protein [Pleurocapsa minor GSE-CHR-MK 17-07R]
MDDPRSSSRSQPPNASMRSPVRPEYTAPREPAPAPQPPPQATEDDTTPSAETLNSQNALIRLRHKMQTLVEEYAQGKINRVQFQSLYTRYSEQRTIIEKLLERNPDSDAWKQVISVPGQTGFLRSQFEAHAIVFAVYLRGQLAPVFHEGRRSPQSLNIDRLVEGLWAIPRPPQPGLGRRALAHGEWLVMALGTEAVTFVAFSLEPSNAQSRLVRDLHDDFERANRLLLARGITAPDRLVFPQRALIEKE